MSDVKERERLCHIALAYGAELETMARRHHQSGRAERKRQRRQRFELVQEDHMKSARLSWYGREVRHASDVGSKAHPQRWPEHITVKVAPCPVRKEAVVKAVPCQAMEESKKKLTEGKEAMEAEENNRERAMELAELKKDNPKIKVGKEELVHVHRRMKMKRGRIAVAGIEEGRRAETQQSKEADRVDLKPPPLAATSCSSSSRGRSTNT